MGRNKERTLTCKDCGATFTARCTNAMRCKDCAVLARRRTAAESYKRLGHGDRPKKRIASNLAANRNHAEIIKANQAFRDQGLTYGQGMARGGR